jgi:hypothetical protein
MLCHGTSALRGEFGISVHQLCSRFTDDNKTHHNGLLGSLIGEERFLAQSFDETACVGCSFLHVIEVVGKPVFRHTGTASAST